MKRFLTFILLMYLAAAAWAQQKPPYPRTSTDQVVSDRSTWASKSLSLPHGTTPGFPSYVPDSLKCGALFYKMGADTGLYVFNCASHAWDKADLSAYVNLAYFNTHTGTYTTGVISNLNTAKVNYTDTLTKIATRDYVASHSPVSTFSSNIVNNTSVKIGSVPAGGTLASAGKTPEQVVTAIFTETIHPAYNIPTASITGSPAAGAYERGSALSITLTSGFTQNDGGSLSSTTYKNGATTITSPYSITLSANTTLTVQKAYNTGVCKLNNLGVLDCQVGSGNAPNPAPVASGTATATMNYTIYDRGYAGYDANALVSGVPAQADILAATLKDNSGGSTINTQVTAQQGSDKYYFFITTTTRSGVTINNTPSTAAFNFNIPITFTNASGGTFTGYAHVSKFPIGSTGAITYVFN